MNEDILSKFGECLRNARIAKGLSQENLAAIVNLDRTYISLLERGKRNPSLICIASLCNALEVKLSELFNEIENYEN